MKRKKGYSLLLCSVIEDLMAPDGLTNPPDCSMMSTLKAMTFLLCYMGLVGFHNNDYIYNSKGRKKESQIDRERKKKERKEGRKKKERKKEKNYSILFAGLGGGGEWRWRATTVQAIFYMILYNGTAGIIVNTKGAVPWQLICIFFIIYFCSFIRLFVQNILQTLSTNFKIITLMIVICH